MNQSNSMPAYIPQLSCSELPVFIMLVLSLLCLTLAGCATWQPPTKFNDSVLRARADIQEQRGVKLSAAVLSSDDSQQMFGHNVNNTGVQPIWVEVENNTEQVLWLLRYGTDPDLFSALEVAWPFHVYFASENNAKLDDHFDALSFQNPVPPGTKKSGIIFTNPHHMTRLLSVDILGQGELFPFTMFPPVPDDQTTETTMALINVKRLIKEVTVDIRETDNFRARLQQLPCCAMSEDENKSGDPLNVILIGDLADVISALVRRGFRLNALDFDRKQRLYGRTPGVVLRKKGQAGAAANWVRVWVAPFRYQDQTVFVVQAGRRQGWRMDEAVEDDLKLNPKVDEVRNLLIQDMVYSSGLTKVAFVDGVGATKLGESRSSLGDASFQTDGLRAVLFFVTRPQ
ncbi:MAG: hypothetical protein V7782_00545, partial [Psychromonas sp.]